MNPGCDRHPTCPGCPLRHHPQPKSHLLQHLATLAPRWPAPSWLGSAPTDAYRAQITARAFGDPITLGMPPTPLSTCPNQTPQSQALLLRVQTALRELDTPAWAPGRKTGVHRVRLHAADTSIVTVEYVAPRGHPPRLFQTLRLGPHTGLYGAVLSPHHVGQRARLHHLSGPRSAVWQDDVGRWQATPPAWAPQSPHTTAILRTTTQSWLPNPGRVLELGCGVGTQAPAFAPDYLGVDLSRAAVEDAKVNVPAASFRVGEATRAAKRLLGEHFDSALLHSMRRGFGPQLLRLLPALGVRQAVYWCPTPEALVRDVEGWKVDAWGALWQLPGTSTVLVGARLSR